MSKSVMIEVDETTKSILEVIENRVSRGTEQSIQGFKTENNTVLQAMSTQLYNRLEVLEKNQSKDLTKLKEQVEDLLDDMEDSFSEIGKTLNGSKEEQVKAVTDGLKKVTDQLLADFNNKLAVLQISSDSLKQEITKLTTIPASLKQSIEKVQAEVKRDLNELQGIFKEQLNSTLEKQEEQVIAFKEQLKSNLDKQEEQVSAFSQKLESVLQSIEEKQNQHEAQIQSSLEGLEEKIFNQLEQLQVKEEMKAMVEKLSLLEKELTWANQPFYKKWFGKRGE
jgi:chromosome segregation ATPase